MEKVRNSKVLALILLASVMGGGAIVAQDVGAQSRPLEQEGRSTMPNIINLTQRVFGIADEKQQPLGTGFRICRPSLVLTATHVIENRRPAEVRVVATNSSPVQFLSPTRIERHPQADVAALFLDEQEQAGLECFALGVPSNDYPGFSDYPLGEDILAYGFPLLESPISARMMKGHIQQYKRNYKGYDAYELAFPAFGGLSGSPVFLDKERNVVIGVVTTSTTYYSEKRPQTPEQEEKPHTIRADWAIGAALHPLAGWLESLSAPM